jgi:hypothetical protein
MIARRLALILGIALAIAACAYKPASPQTPSQDFVGQRTQVGCVDIAVERHVDRPSGAVLGYTFGNRCDHPAVIDLAWGTVIGRTANGAEVALIPDDPEAGAIHLDANQAGSRSIAYPSQDSVGQLCVDVASLAQQKPAQWLCFGNPEAVAMLGR